MLFNDIAGLVGVGAVALATGMLLRNRRLSRERRERHRAGRPDPAPSAAPHDAKAFASTIEERRALALRAIYDEGGFEVLVKTPDAPGSSGAMPGGTKMPAGYPRGLELFAFLGPGKFSVAALDAEREELNHNWGIVDSASCMRTLLSLIDGGARAEFDHWCGVLAHCELLRGSDREIANLAQRLAPDFPRVKKADDSLSLLERLEVARENWRRLHPGGTAAWDYVRIVQVATTACQVGYLDNGQAWAMILDIGNKAAQAFRSWEQLGESFVIGRYLHYGVRMPAYDEAIARLRTHRQSPWRTIPWEYRGPEELPA
jgi:Protein of unknown function (DUF1266)